MKQKTKKLEKGITLIALVITIIVLLILAGVSIAMLTGDNGILTKATESKEKTTEAENDEKVRLAIGAARDNEGNFSQDLLKEELKKQGINESKIDITSADQTVVTTEDGAKYTINNKGAITEKTTGDEKESEETGYTDISKLKYTLGEGVMTIDGLAEGESVKNLNIAPTYTINGIEYGVSSIAPMGFMDEMSLKTVNIPYTVKYFGDENNWKPFLRCWNLEKVTVDENNPNYTSVDGIVYSKDMTQLVFYPGGKKDSTYTIPDSVVKTQNSALYFDVLHGPNKDASLYLKKINIPDSVNYLYFRGWASVPELIISWNETQYSYSDVDKLNSDWQAVGKDGGVDPSNW